MHEVATDVWHVSFGPRDAVNAYLVGDVLIDAGTAAIGKQLIMRLTGQEVAAHAITHAHPDHVRGASVVCAELGIDLWAPEETQPMSSAGVPPSPPGPGQPR